MNNDFVVLSFKIIPNSKEFGFAGFDSWSRRIRLKVKNPALKEKANNEIIEKLSKIFGAEVKIIKGLKSGRKEILIRKDKELVLEKLKELTSQKKP